MHTADLPYTHRYNTTIDKAKMLTFTQLIDIIQLDNACIAIEGIEANKLRARNFPF